ncbi:arginine-tRNA-protein transferase [Dichomitus squalens]|uniref:arginyltransferase n=1 Tax=Dichomitus squalens TaxID=114155 RepID=A0A4Q9PV48_9APHY|nr:arginine-tRNA-protein transferase [Dichomitus squalens]
MSSREPPTIFSPLRPRNSTCGYCGSPGKRSEAQTSYHAAEGIAHVMGCRVYQEMMDRGWRRSGTYYYKPDLRRSCCPQYTIRSRAPSVLVRLNPPSDYCSIRLDAIRFRPSKSQRKLINRFNRHISNGDQHDGGASVDISEGTSTKGKGRRKGKAEHVFKLADDIHAAELRFLRDETPAHKYEVTLEPASFTQEKFALYQSYQKHIHNDDDVTPGGFTRFLCKSLLVPRPITYLSGAPSHLPQSYGSFHQLHRIDGQLIAMSVIDVVPNCVSSVYFMYEKKWEKFSLGKLSAMREVSLVKEMHEAGLTDMKFLYMGFYIHSCVKMRYKGEYSPTYVLDPEDYTWFPLEQFRPHLDQYHYASCAHPDRCLDAPATEAYPPQEPADEVLDRVRVMVGFEQNTIIVGNLTESDEWNDNGGRFKEAILRTLNGLGDKLAGEILLDFSYDIAG